MGKNINKGKVDIFDKIAKLVPYFVLILTLLCPIMSNSNTINKTDTYYFQLGEKTHLRIETKTKLSIQADIKLNSNINGKGDFFVYSPYRSVVFLSNGYSVENIYFDALFPIDIRSQLMINNRIEILRGIIRLHNQNIILSNTAYKTFNTSHRIVFLGMGELLCIQSIQEEALHTNFFKLTSKFLNISSLNFKPVYILLSRLSLHHKSKTVSKYDSIDPPPPKLFFNPQREHLIV
jgi:hypothetical protein